MSAVEIAVEKVKRLNESSARQLLAWLQQREGLKAPSQPPSAKTPHPDFLSRAKVIWGEQPAGKPLSEMVGEARGGQP